MKKYLVLVTVIYLSVFATLSAQCPLPQGLIHFGTQEDIDSFALNYPNCTQPPGYVYIDEIEDGAITSLAGLSQLTSIGEDLFIGNNSALNSLAGLENITSIGNDLNIVNNDLTNLVGLSGLVYISGNLFLHGDSDIDNLVGLSNLQTIGRTLDISDTNLSSLVGLENLDTIGIDLDISRSVLTNLSGLENLVYIGGSLIAEETQHLINFEGLDNLVTIGEDLYVNDNALLQNFEGLFELNHVGDYLSISRNENLSDISGLPNLRTLVQIFINSNPLLENISGLGNLDSLEILRIYSNLSLQNLDGLTGLNSVLDLRIQNNIFLSSIEGLSNLQYIGELIITNNYNLSFCSVEGICNHLIGVEWASIGSNAEGCNHPFEVLQNCTSAWEYAIGGTIYTDTNSDCLKDAGEFGLDSWLIKIDEQGQGPRYVYTFNGGNYIVPADSGAQYILTPIPPNTLWDDICPATDSVTISTNTPYNNINFGASGNLLCPFLEIDVTAPFIRRCFDSNYYVRYCNSGTTVAENAYVEVQLDPYFTYQNATIAGIDLGENLYSFDLGNVDIGECGNFRIDVYVDCDSTEIGQAHCVEAHIYPDSICTSALPLWDGASIEVDAQCLGDSIEFKIENVGTGDMSDSLEYMVIEEDLTYERANFQLNSGESKVFYKEANGLFHRLEAEQSPGHPGNSMPSVFVEGCGEGDNGEISVGFVNYYLLDEGDAFVSIDCQENIGSYDPNDKQAFPVGYGAPHFITDSTDLEYLIRFQNTGTDTAFNIVIRDTISPHLNIETLRPGVASHDYRYDIEESNIAVFHFENIMLPDSNVNEPASNGFIKFNIEQKENNPIGTHIMNDAAIYFDFNEPIITNTVFHTVGEDFMGIVTSVITPPEAVDRGISVNVFPNPFDEYTRFEVKGETLKELNLSVYDMMGREVFQQQSTHQQHLTMKRNNLAPGVYVFRLMDEKQQLATGKLVVQ